MAVGTDDFIIISFLFYGHAAIPTSLNIEECFFFHSHKFCVAMNSNTDIKNQFVLIQNGTMYYDLTELYHVASPLNFSRLDPDYSQQCYDATWTLARGLDAVVKRKMSLKYE